MGLSTQVVVRTAATGQPLAQFQDVCEFRVMPYVLAAQPATFHGRERGDGAPSPPPTVVAGLYPVAFSVNGGGDLFILQDGAAHRWADPVELLLLPHGATASDDAWLVTVATDPDSHIAVGGAEVLVAQQNNAAADYDLLFPFTVGQPMQTPDLSGVGISSLLLLGYQASASSAALVLSTYSVTQDGTQQPLTGAGTISQNFLATIVGKASGTSGIPTVSGGNLTSAPLPIPPVFRVGIGNPTTAVFTPANATGNSWIRVIARAS